MTSVFSFLRNELSNEQLLEHKPSEYAEKREKVYMFLRLPLILEKFMFYGFMQCCDSFLYIFAFVPLRICFLLLRIIFYPFRVFFNYTRIFEKPQMVDAIKFILIVACVYTLTFIDTSMVYHIIRGQAIIKLYIFFNMLEVADRLLCSIGQDILDALLYTVIEPNKSKIRAIPHLFIAIIYMFVHSMIILCQATTLNVAFNSHNKALLTIMMSNNFVELKGSVFKKFDINNLFQMSCSDAKERFQNLILLLVVLIRNMTEFDWEMDQLYEMIPVFCMVFFSEFLIDWIKIAFVLKFNNISYEVFNDFKLDLARNYIESKKKKVLFDVQIRSYGFVPLPLFCLFLRVCAQSIQLNVFLSYFNVFIGFICILMLKMLVSLIIFGLSCKWIEKLGSGTSGEGGEKPQVHVLPAEPTEEPKEPILLVNDEDINDVTFTGIHELKSEESLQNESLLKDIEEEPDEKAATTGKRPIKLIVSGNLRTRRIILFSNSTKFSIKKAHIKCKKTVRS